MSIDSINIIPMHRVFENRISDNTYNNLENMYRIVVGEESSLTMMNSHEKIPEDMQSADSKMKKSIIYIRQCSIIKKMLLEYEEEKEIEEELKRKIDYYINSNTMQEMNTIGMGWYYDVKYEKNTSNLYSVGYGSDSNWFEWLQGKNVKNNHIKENGIQLIFTACKEHINRGGKVRLKSLSKCFGVDMFKYMQLDDSFNANLYIIKNAPINFINVNDKETSLQSYILSDEIFDVNNNPQFCMDFSHPREKDIENYNKWSKKFLQSDNISQKEFNEKKESYNIEGEEWNYVILEWLKQERTQSAEKAISSRTSPISDKEVIASDSFWSIENYNDNLSINDIVSGKCYHFKFNSAEYCQLIFSYFNMSVGKKFERKFLANYNSVINYEKESIKKELTDLDNKQKKIDSQREMQLQTEEIETLKKEYEYNKSLIRIFSLYEEFLNNISIENIPIKIQLALSFIDWNSEEIPKNWSTKNIYNVKNNKEENLRINLYKCICKKAALMGA